MVDPAPPRPRKPRRKATTRRAPKTRRGPPGLEGEVGADRARSKLGETPPTVDIPGSGQVVLSREFFKTALLGGFDSIGELTARPETSPKDVDLRQVWKLSEGEAGVYGICLEEIVKRDSGKLAERMPWYVLGFGLGLSALSRMWTTSQVLKARKAAAPARTETPPLTPKPPPKT